MRTMPLLPVCVEVIQQPWFERPPRFIGWTTFLTRLAVFLLASGTIYSVTGYGGGHSMVTPAQGSIAFVAPSSGTTITSLPVNLQVTFSGAATLPTSQITLNGADITSSFVVSGSTATATVDSDVFVGSNRLVATVGSHTSSAQFAFDP
jgi:hypothetical protein